jgi:hypothetical protein
MYSTHGPQWEQIATALNSIRDSVSPAYVRSMFEQMLREKHPHATAARSKAAPSTRINAASSLGRPVRKKRRHLSTDEVLLPVGVWPISKDISCRAAAKIVDHTNLGEAYERRTGNVPPTNPTERPPRRKQCCKAPAVQTPSKGSAVETISNENLTVTSDGRNAMGESTCRACLTNTREVDILLCDSCAAEYHMRCLDPPLATVPAGAWFCPSCSIGCSLLGQLALTDTHLSPTGGAINSAFNRLRRALNRKQGVS